MINSVMQGFYILFYIMFYLILYGSLRN